MRIATKLGLIFAGVLGAFLVLAAVLSVQLGASDRGTVTPALSLCGGLLLLLGALGLMTVRSTLGRLARLKSIAHRLARAELDRLDVSMFEDEENRQDEIGEFAESLQAISAIIEELLVMATSPAVFNSRETSRMEKGRPGAWTRN